MLPAIELPEAFQVYVNAYIALDTEREPLQDIPWSAFVRYGEYYNFTREQIEWLIEIGRRVDKAVLAERHKQHGNASRSGRPAKQTGR